MAQMRPPPVGFEWAEHDLPSGGLVDVDRGLISRAAFDDRVTHRREEERLLPGCWAWVGQTSQVASAGDFVTTSIGTTPYLLWRDRHGALRLFSNVCPHEEARVCPFDEGSANRLTCGSHLWTFDSDGMRVDVFGMPGFDSSEEGQSRLTEVPRFVVDHGFVFGNSNPDAAPLVEAFGPLGAWWERVGAWGDAMGGWELQPYSQRWRLGANWKYFTIMPEGDPIVLLFDDPALQLARVRTAPSRLRAMADIGARLAPVRDWEVEENLVRRTMQWGPRRGELETLGPEVGEFFIEASRRWSECLQGSSEMSPHPGTPLLFPNLLYGGASLLTGLTLLQVQPRGLSASEVSARYLLPGHAPPALRQAAAEHAKQGTLRAADLELPSGGVVCSRESASRAFYREWARRLSVG